MFIASKWIKATRKPHDCLFCDRSIDVGERAESVFNASGKEVNSFYLCGWCADHLYDVTAGEDFVDGELYDHVLDRLTHEDCVCQVCKGSMDMNIDTKQAIVALKCECCGAEVCKSLNDVLGY